MAKPTLVADSYWFMLGQRVVVSVPVTLFDNLSERQRQGMIKDMEYIEVNMIRREAKHLLVKLKNEIKETGNERERNEGVPRLKQICRRLDEWV
jgi:hypothetical protein